jgi:periplasmic copper chaperone A
MKKLIFTLLLSSIQFIAFADSNLLITDAWIREGSPVSRVLAGYLTLKNQTNRDISLIGISSPDAGMIEIHETIEKDGMMSMDYIPSVLIQANSSITLSPGHKHLMLMNISHPFKAGEQIKLAFKFDNGQKKTIMVMVKVAD